MKIGDAITSLNAIADVQGEDVNVEIRVGGARPRRRRAGAKVRALGGYVPAVPEIGALADGEWAGILQDVLARRHEAARRHLEVVRGLPAFGERFDRMQGYLEAIADVRRILAPWIGE